MRIRSLYTGARYFPYFVNFCWRKHQVLHIRYQLIFVGNMSKVPQVPGTGGTLLDVDGDFEVVDVVDVQIFVGFAKFIVKFGVGDIRIFFFDVID